MRILIFGDSITQGLWDVEGGWVDRLRRSYDELTVRDLNFDRPIVFNVGVSADTSKNLVERITPETKARTFRDELPVVVVQIGVNDSAKTNSQFWTEPAVYQSNLEKIADSAKDISAGLVFVGLSAVDESLTNPISWDDYYSTNDEIKKYENIMQQVASFKNVSFIPLFDRFKQALDQGQNLLTDGLHPNDAGHKLIYETVSPQLKQLIQEPTP